MGCGSTKLVTEPSIVSTLTVASSRALAATQCSSAAGAARAVNTKCDLSLAFSAASSKGPQKPAELEVVPVTSTKTDTPSASLAPAVSTTSAWDHQKPAELVVVPVANSAAETLSASLALAISGAAETPRLLSGASMKAASVASPISVGSVVSRTRSAELPGASAWVHNRVAAARELPWESAWVYSGMPARVGADEPQLAVAEDLYDSDSWSECELIEDLSPIVNRQTAREAEKLIPPLEPQPTPRWAELVAHTSRCHAKDLQFEQLLARRAWEITGLLRPKLSSAEELRSVQEQLDRTNNFLVESLPHAVETVGVTQVAGLVFQALLVRAGLGRSSGPTRPSADELDAKLGKAKALKLADRARELRELLRVKVEDDGDLALARQVVQDCRRFLAGLAVCSERRGMKNWELLQELLHGNQSGEGKLGKDVPFGKSGAAFGGA